LREEVFLLAYLVPGFTHPIADMDPEERTWYMERLNTQLKSEQEAIERATKRGRAKARK